MRHLAPIIIYFISFWGINSSFANEELPPSQCYVGTSAREAHVQEIQTSFIFRSEGLKGFCYCADPEKDIILPEYSSCLYQPTLEVADWLKEGGRCYNPNTAKTRENAVSKINNVTIENNFIVDGSSQIELFLMRRNAPCNILIFNIDKNIKTQSGNIPSWLLALHLLYTNYGDINSWPMPNMAMKKDFIKKFGNTDKITEIHKGYLYTTWKDYLLKNNDRVRRWIPFNPGNDM